MTKHVFFKVHLILFLGLWTVSAQVQYEKGYIVKDDNSKEIVFIKNLDWSNTPERFKYKLNETDNEVLNGSLQTIKEFGIGDHIKYVKHTVNVDLSSTKSDQMTNYPEPNFERRTVFLKQLVEGMADLYMYRTSSYDRFFYSIHTDSMIPLIYKQYKVRQSEILENASFRKELYDNLKCETISPNKMRNLDYDKRELTNFFSTYNTCKGVVNKVYKSPNKKGDINIALKLGVFSNSLSFDQSENFLFETLRSVELETKTSMRFAVEFEYVLPFNKNKWSLFVEPGYEQYSSSGVSNENLEEPVRVNVEYNYINVPVGLRYYMFLNNSHKLFLSAGAGFTIDLSDNIEYRGGIEENRPINSNANFMFGLGYNFDDKISIEARVNTARSVVSDEILLSSEYRGVGVILAYYFL